MIKHHNIIICTNHTYTILFFLVLIGIQKANYYMLLDKQNQLSFTRYTLICYQKEKDSNPKNPYTSKQK